MSGPVHDAGHEGLWVEVTTDLYNAPSGYGAAGDSEDLRTPERNQDFIDHVTKHEARRLERLGGRVTGVRAWLDGREIYATGARPTVPVQPTLFGGTS